jgi:hypothetical protein
MFHVKHFILCIGVVHYKTVPKHFYESLTHSKNRAKVCRQMLKNGKGDP